MTKLQVQDAKTQLLDANDAIFALAQNESRSISDGEKSTIQANLRKIEELDFQLLNENFKDPMASAQRVQEQRYAKPKETFSLMRAIRSAMNKSSFSDIDANVNALGLTEFRNTGITTEGNIILPYEVRADILAGTASAGAEIVATQKGAILPPLTDALVFGRAGVTFLTGLVGDFSLPSYAGTTVAWKTEVQQAADGGGAFSSVDLSPKRLTAYIDVSKQFLAQDSVGAERLLMANIADAVARKLEATILGVADGSSSQPQGMGYKITTGTDTKAAAAVPSWATIVGLESTVDGNNALQNSIAYITNAAGRGILKGIQKVATYGSEMLCEDNMVNGYPLLVTNSCSGIAGSDAAGELLVFGNWADLVIGQWAGYDITVDPYSMATYGKVRIVINAYFDAKGRRGSAATDVHGVVSTSADNYALAFASMAIKAS